MHVLRLNGYNLNFENFQEFFWNFNYSTDDVISSAIQNNCKMLLKKSCFFPSKFKL